MTVLVVGGGITGLASAYALGKAGVTTLLVEQAPRLGGKVRTETIDGFVIEHGPDSFVSYRPAGVQLCRELGLGDAIIRPQEPRTVFVRTGGHFLRFPEGMGLVLPTKLRPFLESELFSPFEKLRMGLDLVLPRDGTEGDIAVGPFLRRRLGRALVDRLAGPLIGGVYGTPIDELSLDAVVPQLRESERRHRSLLLAALSDARARKRAAPGANGGAPGADGARDARSSATSPSPFVTLAGGTQQLVDALIQALETMPNVGIRTGTLLESLALDGPRVRARFRGGERLAPEAVILATPARATAALLERDVPDAAAHIRSIPHGTTAVVNLAYRADQLPDDLTGHGFLVAGDEELTISAATLSSRKWAGRAPDETLLVRAFIGDGRAGAHALDEEQLVQAAHRDLAGTLRIRGGPMLTRVSRYPAAMPHYTVGHLDRVSAAQAALTPYPALRIAGGAYRGVGLPDCIGQGRVAAGAVTALLSRGEAAAAGPAAAVDDWAESVPVSRGVSLDALPVGRVARVVSIEGDHDADLALEGLLPGTAIAITSRAPLGGPLVVGIGRSRVAVARSLAARISVEPVTDVAVDVSG
jgi:oxygen-dependent protoporphyrinogen oxidase